MALYLDKISPDAKITMNGFADGAVEGHVFQDISFGGSTNFSAPEHSTIQQKASDAIGKVTSAANAFGTGLAQVQHKNVRGTILTWQGSDNFILTIPMFFVAYKPGDDVRIPCRTIIKSCYPKIAGSPNFASVMVAPNGYVAGDANNTEGKISIRIGKWLKTEQVFIVDSVDFSFSKETMEDTGFPAWATGVVNFRSFRILGDEEVAGMIS